MTVFIVSENAKLTHITHIHTYTQPSYILFVHSYSLPPSRWIMSTLANIIALLQNWRKATMNNNSISFLFIAYQGLMLFSTVVRCVCVCVCVCVCLSICLSIYLSICLSVCADVCLLSFFLPPPSTPLSDSPSPLYLYYAVPLLCCL